MMSKRHGLTALYAIISLFCFIMGAIFIKKNPNMDIQLKLSFILIVLISIAVVISSLFTCDFFIEDDFLLLKSDIAIKKYLISELELNGIQIFGRPHFIITIGDRNFRVTYTVENFNVLKQIVRRCKSSKVTEQEIRQIENTLLHPF